MKLLIDWSVICHINWHKMKSPDYEARTDIEQAEFARNMAGTLLYYQQRFQPEEILLAMDGKSYWRYQAYDKYYDKHTQVFMTREKPEDQDEHIYYMRHDCKTYQLEYHSGMEKWIRTKLKKAEVKTFEMGLNPPGEEKPLIAQLVKGIPEGIKDMYPQYKGSRKESSWDYTTTRKEFKDMCNSIARNMAKTLGARVIQEEGAEADDIAHVYHQKNTSTDLVYITTDSDWEQLLSNGVFLKFYNPRHGEWTETSQERARLDLAIKIVGGDSGDGIPGLRLAGKDTLTGPKNAEKIVLEKGIDNIYKWLGEKDEKGKGVNVDQDMLTRNYQLIFLANCPTRVKKAITKILDTPEKPAKKKLAWKEYGLDATDIVSIKETAKEARESDVEEGHYE